MDLRSPVATAAVTVVTASITVVTLAAANAARTGLSVYNDSTAQLYLKEGLGASLTNFTVIMPGKALYETPFPAYPGIVTGIWDSATGSAKVTERA